MASTGHARSCESMPAPKDGNEEGTMDSVKALAATAAIRQMVEALTAELQPKPTRQDVQKELKIIRENSPPSCKGKIGSVSAWLYMLFTPGKDRKLGTIDPHDIVLNTLARIEAEIAQGLPDSVRANRSRGLNS
jgi:hypothetical protein